jgi:hypothetical protein
MRLLDALNLTTEDRSKLEAAIADKVARGNTPQSFVIAMPLGNGTQVQKPILFLDAIGKQQSLARYHNYFLCLGQKLTCSEMCFPKWVKCPEQKKLPCSDNSSLKLSLHYALSYSSQSKRQDLPISC